MIKHGEKVLIYGESGTGKSTVVKLLTKYLDNSFIPLGQQAEDMIYLVSLLHLTTTYDKKVDLDSVKEIYRIIESGEFANGNGTSEVDDITDAYRRFPRIYSGRYEDYHCSRIVRKCCCRLQT